MAENSINDITTALDKLKSSEGTEAIKKSKADIQKLRSLLYDKFSKTQFIRDPQRLIISAPEIIIGNVDRAGNLISDEDKKSSIVVIRSGAVSLQATQDMKGDGVIECKAPYIRNMAVDPGVDGLEEVVSKCSIISSQAKSIVLESDNDTDCFIQIPNPEKPGLTLMSDTTLDITAAIGDKTKTKAIDKAKMSLTATKAKLSATMATQLAALTAAQTKLNLLLSVPDTEWSKSSLALRTLHSGLWKLQDEIMACTDDLYQKITLYTMTLSQLAEVTRKMTALDKMKTETSSKSASYKTDSTKTALNLTSENINVLSADGDANVRDNKTAGIEVKAPHLFIETTDAKGKLVKDSTIDINTKTYTLSTGNAEYSDSDKKDSGTLPAVGDVNIFSKNVLIQGTDNKLSSGKQEEEKLTKDSTIKIRAEKVTMQATDKEGKATGSVKVDAKDVRVRAMDVDPKSGDEKKQSDGGQLFMLAEKMFMGSNSKKTKLVQVAAEKIGIIGKDTAEMQQDGKAVITANGGKVTVGASSNEINGNTTIKGNAEIKGETKTPKLTTDQATVNMAFKSANINDTMGAGVPEPAGQPSAKMKEEDAKS